MNSSRLLLILDLDETLVRATEDQSIDPPDFMVGSFRVRRRPGLADFLRTASRFSDIAVWSSASELYVEEIVKQIIPTDITLKFAWARSRCTRRYDGELMEEYWVKDLRKAKRLGYDLDRILIIDDSPEKIERNYGNHVRVKPFLGDPSDSVLPSLSIYLENISTLQNLRSVEKRGWETIQRKEAEPVRPANAAPQHG